MSLFEKIKAGKKQRKLTVFPGTDIAIEFRLITEQDKHLSNFAADAVYKDCPINFHNVSDYQAEKTLQQLYRAIVVPGTDKPAFKDITEFRLALTTPVRDILVDEYSAFDSECNPSPLTMPDEEFDKLMFDLKKKPEQTIGNISNLHTLRRLSTCLALHLQTLPTDSGSTSM